MASIRSHAGDRSRLTAAWLTAVALLVLAMVVVGGATRLTGSGLSITQWKPISGALPPLGEAAWRHAFDLYRATPQYRLVNQGMSLADFQFIYWWEWSHRLLGRLIGVVFAVPCVLLLVLHRLPRRLLWPCVVLFLLGALQGLVGWWMVRSGLEARVSVAPERLATHLGLALALFVALVWTALEAWSGPGPRGGGRRDGWPMAGAVFAAGIFFQCLLGALVAGNRAGLVDNDWPLMGGAVIPTDYWRGGLWATLAHGLSAVQFNHRMLAYALALAALAIAIVAARSRRAPGAVRGLALALAAITLVQASLGVSTLVMGVPLALALLHQACAAILLACAVSFAWQTRRNSTVA